MLYQLHSSTAARGEPVCRRVSRDVCDYFGSPSSGTGGWGFCFGVFPTILYHVYFSPAARGKPVCRRVSRDVCGDCGSPPSRMGRGNFDSASLNSSIPRFILPGCARHLRRIGSPSSGTGGCGICFGVFPTILYHVYFFPAARGEPVCRRLSRDVCGYFGLPPNGTGRWGFLFGVFPTMLYQLHFLTAARGEPVCRRVTRDVCGYFGSPPSRTGEWGF